MNKKRRLKIYFASSIRGGRENTEQVHAIIEMLQEYGDVLTEHVGDTSLTSDGEITKSDFNIYVRDSTWINEADVVVAEVSTPSLGVGYEIGYAESHGTKIICLYCTKSTHKLSAMIAGNLNLKVIRYLDLEEIQKPLKTIFGEMR